MATGEGVRLITLGEVLERIPYSKVHIYRMMKQESFPNKVEVGPQRVAWVQSEIDEWIAERLRHRESGIDSQTDLSRRELAKEAVAARRT